MLSAVLLVLLVGGNYAEDPPAVPSSLLQSDVDGLISTYASTSYNPKLQGYLQYGHYELHVQVHLDGSSKTCEITCAPEKSKCRLYDNVENTWRDTTKNKIYYNGETFYQVYSKNIRDHFSSSFSLLLSSEKQERKESSDTFVMAYQTTQNFLGTLTSNDENILADVKVLFMDGTTVSPSDSNPLIQSKMGLDARLVVDGGSYIHSSTGFIYFKDLYGVRRMENLEYAFAYEHKKPVHKDPPLSITVGKVKQDLESVDPELRCQKRDNVGSIIGFMEYTRNIFTKVLCEKNKYRVATVVTVNEHPIDAYIECPMYTEGDGQCKVLEWNQLYRRMTDRGFLDDERQISLGHAHSDSGPIKVSVLKNMNLIIVHYFHLDDKFKLKMRAMLKLFNFDCGKDGQGEQFAAMRTPGKLFTVPAIFECQKNHVQIGSGKLLLVDNELPDFLPVESLFYYPEEESTFMCGKNNEFEYCGPEAIRSLGTSKDLRTPDDVNGMWMDQIMKDLIELREKYLETIKVKNAHAKIPLKVDGNVVLVINGQRTVNNMQAVEIQTQVAYDQVVYRKMFFTGEKLMIQDDLGNTIDNVNPENCYLWVMDNDREDNNYEEGIIYYSEDEFTEKIRKFSGTLSGRCLWFDEKGLFRLAIYNDKGSPVIKGLFDCSSEVFLLKGPFDVLRSAHYVAEEEDLYVFGRERSWTFNTDDVFAVKIGRSIDVPELASMGPQVFHSDGWSISMQMVSTA